MAGMKRSCPSELRQQGEEIASKMANLDDSLRDLDKENKRWMIIGIVMNTVMSPALRAYVKPKLDQLYQKLNNSNNIGSQQYPNQMQFHSGTFLNYQAINNNKSLGRQQEKNFDYDVKNSVDLSKLFLETNMAKHSAIDESCDLSALLGIVIKSGISPVSATQCADKLRDKVRNPWAHCMYSEWNETKYIESFKIMEQLVNDSGFPTQEETDLITNLHKWKNRGDEFIENKTTKILTEVTKEIRDLIKSAEVMAVDTPEEMCKLKEELVKMETILLNHADRIHQLEQTTREHSGKIDALENFIPSNMRAQHKMYIDEWKRDEDTFTHTRATKQVTELIKTNDVVMVTGSSGSGKSTILHHVALQLEQKYEIIPFILSPDDIMRYRDVKKNQLLIIDDLCGKNLISENDLGNWKNHMDKIGKLFSSATSNEQTQKGKLKILIACRLHILKDEKMKRLNMFTKQVVDLHSKKYCLNQDEKTKMIENYTGLTLSKSDFKKIEEMLKDCSYFPILCKMSAGKQVDQMYKLFSSPVDSIRQDIKEMIQSNKFAFCALVLCVLFQHGFPAAFIKPRTTSKKVKQKMTKIVKIFEINLENELHRRKLESAFNQMNGTYIKKTGRKFSISHDMLYDMVSVTCGQKLVELFIEFAPSSFIADQCRFSSVFTDQSLNQDETLVYLQVDTETIYFDRVVKDLKDDDVSSLFLNRQLKNSMYRGKLMRYILQNKDLCTQVFIKLDKTWIKQRRKFGYSKYTSDFETTPMIEAVKAGFYELVEFLIQCKMSVNNTDIYEFSPLFYAYENGFMNIVNLLLRSGVNDDKAMYWACYFGDTNSVATLIDQNVGITKCTGYSTPLFAACNRGHTDIVQLLLDRNVDLSQFSRDEKSPLYAACEGGHIDIVQLLLDRNVDMSQTSRRGSTPLYAACKGGHIDIVKILLDRNVDMSQTGWRGGTPLYAACEGGHIDIVKLLLDRNVDVSHSNCFEMTPLIAACKGGHIDIVQLLLDKNVDVSQTVGFGQTPLYAACEGGHTDIVQLLLDRNVDVSQTGPFGDTPLIVACEGGHIDIVKLLLDKNVDVSHSGRCGQTPLYVAFEGGHTDIVKLLLDKNVDVSHSGQCGQTPLYAACQGGHIDIVKLLLDRNVDVSQTDWLGCTPLYAACGGGHIVIVKLLLDRNVDVSHSNCFEVTPLIAACKGGHIDIVKLLLDRNVDVSQTDWLGGTPLYAACEGGHIDIVKLLLDRNVDVSHSNCFEVSPLIAACQGGHTDIVQLLLDRNVDVSQTGPDGETLLIVACEGGHIDIVKLLLDKIVDVSQPVGFGQTPLIAACKGGHTDIVQLLLDRNVDVSQTGPFGDTPLIVACEGGHIDIVKLLLDKNVDVSQTGRFGDTPLYDACKGGHIDIVKLLLDRNSDVSHSNCFEVTPLIAACKGGHIDIVQLLLDRNVDVSQPGPDGETPLYVACQGGHTDIVQLLLDRNVDMSQSGRFGQTPLIVACQGGHTDIVQLLLDRNVDMSQPGPDGQTPLIVACQGGHTDIVQLLLDRNVDVSQPVGFGQTPLYAACQGGYADIVQLLLDRNVDVDLSRNWTIMGQTILDITTETIKDLLLCHQIK